MYIDFDKILRFFYKYKSTLCENFTKGEKVFSILFVK